MSQLKAQMLLTLRDRLSGKLSRVRRQMKDIGRDQRGIRREFSETAKQSARMGLETANAARTAARGQSQLLREFRNLKQQSVATRQKLAGVQSRMKDLARTGKTTGSEFRRLRSEASRLKQSLKGNETGLEQLRRKLRSAGTSTRDLARASRDSASALRSSTNAVNTHEKALAGMERRQQALLRLTNRLRDRRNNRMALGAGMGAAGVAGLYAGRQGMRPVQSTVTEFATFEEQMDSVAAVARIDQMSEAYEELASKARLLGATTSFSAQEVAAAMQFQAMAGFDGAAIMASIADVLDLAKATKTGLAETSDISSNILSAFGLDPSEMKRIADVLTATTTRANVDLIMLGESMKYVAPEAKALGVSLEETAAMAGLLGNVGIQGSQAGTSLRAIYQRLAAPTSKGAAALKQLGITAKTANGDLRPVPELLAEIGKATEAMGSADRKEIFKELIGVEAGSAFSALIDAKGFSVFQNLLGALRDADGEASRVATAMGDNLAGDVKGLLSAFSELKMVIGEELNPAMRATVKWLTDATRQTSAWLKENPALARGIGFAAIAIAGLLLVGGGLLAFLGSATIMLAGLRFGLHMLGLRALTSAGKVGLLARMFSGLSLLNPIRWALLIPKLAWRAIVPALSWAGLIGKISWASVAGKLSWRLLIMPLKWGARLIPGIGWALLAGELLWHLLIKPLGWDKYIPDFTWDNVLVALDWLSWVAPIRWLDFIPGFSWKEALGNVDKLDWTFLLSLTTLRGQIEAMRKLFDIDLFEVGKKIINSLLNGMKAVFAQMMAWVDLKIAALKKAFTFNISMPSLFGGGAPAPANDNAASQVTGDQFASGGTVRKSGLQLVGERGAELRYARKGDFIAHHGQLKEMAQLSRRVEAAGSAGGPVSYASADPIVPRLAAASGRAEAAASGKGGQRAPSGRGGNQTTNHNTFHIHGSDPEAIAKEISAIMERQSRRRMSD